MLKNTNLRMRGTEGQKWVIRINTKGDVVKSTKVKGTNVDLPDLKDNEILVTKF